MNSVFLSGIPTCSCRSLEEHEMFSPCYPGILICRLKARAGINLSSASKYKCSEVITRVISVGVNVNCEAIYMCSDNDISLVQAELEVVFMCNQC